MRRIIYRLNQENEELASKTGNRDERLLKLSIQQEPQEKAEQHLIRQINAYFNEQHRKIGLQQVYQLNWGK